MEGRMEMVEVMTIHKGAIQVGLKKTSILGYEKISKRIAFKEVRFNSIHSGFQAYNMM
jgi:hypothetical protein